MDQSGFMHKYYDWAAFETFVTDLHAGDGDVTVQHNVTEVDRYGAKRQIDVKIVRRSHLYKYTTLIECKRWKEPVSRDRIDVLAASIEALGAHNGAIFTTSGFEAGAIAYAKGKGIELYRVRDLTPSEWGLPGRHVSLHLHVVSAEFREIRFTAQAIALVDSPLDANPLAIHMSADGALDPAFDLYSVISGERGPNLVSVLGDAHAMLLPIISNAISASDGEQDGVLQIDAHGELDLTATEFCQLRLQKVAARVERIGFVFRTHIQRSLFTVDRGQDLDFAVMIESFVSDHRLIAQRRLGAQQIDFQEPAATDAPAPREDEPLENGSIIKVFCSPWTGRGEVVASHKGLVGSLLRVAVETQGRKARLSLRTLDAPAK